MGSLRLDPVGPISRAYNGDGSYAGLVDRQGEPIEPAGLTIRSGEITFIVPPTGGAGWSSMLQAACDDRHARGGGTVVIGPTPVTKPFTADKPIILHGDTNVVGCGVGVTNVQVADHFPMAQVYSRKEVTPGVWQVGIFDCEQRAVFYILPEAPFDVRGMTLTPSNYRVPPRFEGMTISSNKGLQDGPVSAIYAPNGSTDPEWARVSGAYASPGYPSGVIDLTANPVAYDGFQVDNFEVYSLSGTPYYAGSDRQRGKIGRNVRGIGCGTLDGGGNIVFDAAGYEIKGNDWVVLPGAGFGGNTSPVKGSGQSGSIRSEINAWTQKGPNAYLAVQDIGVNGASLSASVLNGAYRAQIAAGAGNARTGISVTGVHFLPDDGLVTTGQPSGTIPSVPDDAHNASASFAGYRHCVVTGCTFSTDKNGKTFKFVIAAATSAGVRFSGDLSSETGVKPYLTTPFYTDATGSIGYDYFDPHTLTLHLGVHSNGVAAGADIAHTQFVTVDTPLVAAAGLVGQATGAAPAQGYQGERGFASGTAALATGVAADATTITLTGPIEADLFAEVQFSVGGTATTAAVNAVWQASISTAANTLDTSNARVYAGETKAIAVGLQNQPLSALRVGPIAVNLAQGQSQTYHIVAQGNFSTNATITAAAATHWRRW